MLGWAPDGRRFLFGSDRSELSLVFEYFERAKLFSEIELIALRDFFSETGGGAPMPMPEINTAVELLHPELLTRLFLTEEAWNLLQRSVRAQVTD